MKNIIKLTLLFILFVGCNSKVKKEANVDNEDIEYVDLIGKFKRVELETHPYIKDSFNLNYTNYKVDEEVLKKIKPLLKRDISIKVIMGTWCEDSRLLVPQFFKVIDKLRFNKRKIELIGLDNEKKSPDNYHEIYEILNVPTFIFYRKEKEINRIVEITIETLEKDIFSILSDSGYENAYYGF